jgi:hypothetical protein
MVRNILTIILSIAVIMLVVLGIGWKIWQDKHPYIPLVVESTPIHYYLYSPSDSGTTVKDIAPGSVVIIQLDLNTYTDPSVKDANGTALTVHQEEYNGNVALSFTVSTTSLISVNVQGLGTSTKDFSLLIQPTLP